MKWALLIIALGVLAFVAHKRRSARARNADLPSIVLLLRTPKKVDLHQLSEWLGSETGKPVEILDLQGSDKPGDDKPLGDRVWIADVGAHFMTVARGVMYLIHHRDQPYFENTAEASESVPELRLRKALSEHRAWVSMDILKPGDATPENYRLAARVLSHLVDEDCLALYHPPLNRWVPCSPGETIEALRSDDPLQAVFGEAHMAPVVEVGDDPRMKAAEAEARRRFPDFENAFRTGDGQHFSVKAPVSAGANREHIWIEVDQITDSEVRGKLGNEPVSLGDLKMGAEVTVSRETVEDWMYVKRNTLVGAFTKAVFEQILKEREKR